MESYISETDSVSCTYLVRTILSRCMRLADGGGAPCAAAASVRARYQCLQQFSSATVLIDKSVHYPTDSGAKCCAPFE